MFAKTRQGLPRSNCAQPERSPEDKYSFSGFTKVSREIFSPFESKAISLLRS